MNGSTAQSDREDESPGKVEEGGGTVGESASLPRRWWLFPAGVFCLTRALVLVVSFLSLKLFSTANSHLPWRVFPENLWLDGLVRWDAGWYLSIINNGYFFDPGGQSSVAFFPLYPGLVRWVTPAFGDPAIAGIVVSHLCFLGALLVFYRLAFLQLGSESMARRVVWYLSIAPTACIFSAVYTESLFLLLIVTAVYLARSERWIWAAVVAALASSTRIVGIAMWGVLGLMWMQAHGWRWVAIRDRANWALLAKSLREHWKSFAVLQIAPCGLLAYMLWLHIKFGDPFVFLQTMEHWDRSTGGGIIAALSPVIGSFREMDWVGQSGSWLEANRYTYLFDAAAFAGAALTIPFVFWRFGAAYGMLSLIFWYMPVSSGAIASFARYSLVIFPLYLVWAQWGRRPLVDRFITGIFLTAGTLATILFALGMSLM